MLWLALPVVGGGGSCSDDGLVGSETMPWKWLDAGGSGGPSTACVAGCGCGASLGPTMTAPCVPDPEAIAALSPATWTATFATRSGLGGFA